MDRHLDLRLRLARRPAREESVPVVTLPPNGIALEEIERQALLAALERCSWVQQDAAKLLAISPRVMNYKMKTLGIPTRRQLKKEGSAPR